MSNAIVYLTTAVEILREEMDILDSQLIKQYDENLDLKVQKIDNAIKSIQNHIDNIL